MHHVGQARKEYNMALTINTNLSSMIVQSNLSKATTSLNQAIERMTTGFKINHAKDNAAGYSIATNWNTQLGSLDVAADNAATGADNIGRYLFPSFISLATCKRFDRTSRKRNLWL